MGRASVIGQRATASIDIHRKAPEPNIESRDGHPDFGAMPGAVCIYRRGADKSLQFTYFSVQAEPLLGRTPEPLIVDPMALVNCVHPDDRELLLHLLGCGPDEAKARFLAMMTHEIRAPLNGVIGMTGMRREAKLTPAQQDYADMVLDFAKSLVALINDVLGFSKLDGDSLELEATGFDVVHLATNIFRVFELMADSSGLDFMLGIAPETVTRLQGDPSRLRQVLVNLVGNAVKFTSEDLVSLSLLGTTREVQPMIQFEVIDTGIGIPEAAKARLFSEFSQAGNSISRRFGGSGLGLAISQKLARLMDGEIDFDSSVGIGSRFWFEIPIVEHSTPACADAEDRSIEGMRVLLAGLSPVDCDLIRGGLEAGGALVEKKTGLAALTAFDEAASGGAATAYRFVTIDNDIAEPAADVLASRLSEHPGGSGTSLVLLASTGMRGDASHASASGFSAHLTKPFSAHLIRECLTELAGRPDSETAASLVTAHSLREQFATGLNVLFADDNDLQHTFVRRLLAARGHRVTAVEDGRAVLEAIADGEFDFALLGEHVAKLGGLATLCEIRGTRGDRRFFPVFVVTSVAGPTTHSSGCSRISSSSRWSTKFAAPCRRAMSSRSAAAISTALPQSRSREYSVATKPFALPLSLWPTPISQWQACVAIGRMVLSSSWRALLTN